MNSLKITYKFAKRVVVTLLGGTVLLLGIIMIIAPGPALVFIPAGLAILGLEFAWARLWMKRVRRRISEQNQKRNGERAEAHRHGHTG